MVDIFKELDGYQRSERPDVSGNRPGRRYRWLVLSAGLISVVALGALWFLKWNQPPVGRELSPISGVSIIRRGITHSEKIVRNRIEGRGSGKIYRDGYGLLCALADALDQKLPLIVRVSLPKGKYRVSVLADDGGRKALQDKLVLAYSEAFGVRISVEQVETPVYVMECDDPLVLGLERTSSMGETFEGDFVDTDDSGGRKDAQYKCMFISQIPNLADYAGYMIRKSWELQDEGLQPAVLAAEVVDETGLKGYYGSWLTWKFYDPKGLVDELTKKGLRFRLENRTINAVVVDLPPEPSDDAVQE